MKDGKVLRIAVGEKTGRRSSTWRIWFGPRDIYAAFRVVAAIRKASIHFPREERAKTLRYIGYTRDYSERLTPEKRIRRERRTHWEWPGMEIAPGYFLEFRFRIPESELRFLDSDEAEDVVWIPPPPEAMAVEVTILSGPSSHED